MNQHITKSSGTPIPSDDHSLTAGPVGPVVLHDHYLVEKLAHFNRERIPERVVHAKGTGAFGEFVVTHDVSQYTKAELFQPGAKTKFLVRFSSVAGEQGSPDTWRDPRGFAIKFYTSQGNYDLVGNNTPVFFIRDAIKFPDFIHSQKRLPGPGLRDNNMQWDFWTLSPETAHQVTWLFGDRGIPKNFRHQDGYGSHTFQWINKDGERFWIKYHFKTDQGIDYLTQEEADEIAGKNADHYRKDLYDTLEAGGRPSWTLKVQIMPVAEAKDYRFNPFDLTKVWSQKDYPLIEVGKWTLTENPKNFFAEVEQASFDPSNLVPGIGLSPDKVLLGRSFAYADAARYRVGVNYEQLPVNKPVAPVHSYLQDGFMAYEYKDPGHPVYQPNSFGGPTAHRELVGDYAEWDFTGGLDYYPYAQHKEDDDFIQAGQLVREVFDDEQRDRFVNNIVGHVSGGVKEPVLSRVFEYWKKVDAQIGKRIEEAYWEAQESK